MGHPCNDTTGTNWTNCPMSSPYTTNRTWTGLRLNPVMQVARPTANCQSCCTEHSVPWHCKDDVAASILRIVKINDTCLESAKPVAIWTDICKTERLKYYSCNEPLLNCKYVKEWTQKKVRDFSIFTAEQLDSCISTVLPILAVFLSILNPWRWMRFFQTTCNRVGFAAIFRNNVLPPSLGW